MTVLIAGAGPHLIVRNVGAEVFTRSIPRTQHLGLRGLNGEWILDNAIRFTEAGFVDVQLSVSAADSPSTATLTPAAAASHALP